MFLGCQEKSRESFEADTLFILNKRNVSTFPEHLASMGVEYKYCNPTLIRPYHEYDDFGLHALCKNKKRFVMDTSICQALGIPIPSDSEEDYKAFSFHEFQKRGYYLLGIIRYGQVIFHLYQKDGTYKKALFSITGFGDGGVIIQDVATFEHNLIKISYWNRQLSTLDYKYCEIDMDTDNPKIDTLQKVRKENINRLDLHKFLLNNKHLSEIQELLWKDYY